MESQVLGWSKKGSCSSPGPTNSSFLLVDRVSPFLTCAANVDRRSTETSIWSRKQPFPNSLQPGERGHIVRSLSLVSPTSTVLIFKALKGLDIWRKASSHTFFCVRYDLLQKSCWKCWWMSCRKRWWMNARYGSFSVIVLGQCNTLSPGWICQDGLPLAVKRVTTENLFSYARLHKMVGAFIRQSWSYFMAPDRVHSKWF